jgi:broad specificity phosphatase PhoE
MKIYILRHEDRTQDCSFFSPLTETGLNNSVKLIDYLKKENITQIYCSPFIRTLQTIYPYAKSTNTNINLEYGLCELHHQDLIPKKAVGMTLPEYLAKAFNCNLDYKTVIKSTDIVYPETNKEVSKRVRRFLQNLIVQNFESCENIVLVSHQSVCCEILKIVNRSDKIDESLKTSYNKGKLSLVFDSSEWKYKSIN